MSDHPDDNLCDALLGTVPPPADPDLRRRLLRQTTRLLRRRVWGGRLLLAAVLAACYLGGVLTGRLAPDVPAHSDPPAPQVSPAPPAAVVEASTPALLEERAFDSLDERAALYRRAGDRYAAEQGDWESALRCYRNSLDVAADKDLEIAPGDNWLLMALKEARKQERKYAQNRN
jgi:hypothetical protein